MTDDLNEDGGPFAGRGAACGRERRAQLRGSARGVGTLTRDLDVPPSTLLSETYTPPQARTSVAGPPGQFGPV